MRYIVFVYFMKASSAEKKILTQKLLACAKARFLNINITGGRVWTSVRPWSIHETLYHWHLQTSCVRECPSVMMHSFRIISKGKRFSVLEASFRPLSLNPSNEEWLNTLIPNTLCCSPLKTMHTTSLFLYSCASN